MTDFATDCRGVTVKVGDRIRIVGLMDDPLPIPVGEEGLVTQINRALDGFQLWIDWDGPHNLMLIERDPFEIIPS